ncbi:MAG: hypothetical protein J1E39_05485 [Eubacterium sp.]|nr:hypothetical protein [Eubacterium sp.]
MFENTFTSDFEVNEISGEPGLFYIMSVDHEGLMCAGANYLFKVDFDGNLIYEPVIFSEDGYYDTYQMDDHKVIVISCSDVMSIIDLQEQTVDILKEKVGRAAYYEGNIYYNTYYVKDDKFYNKLMRCDENGQNEEELLQDCIRFCFTGEDVFYVKQYGNFTLYKYNISTGKDESVLYLPDLTDEYQKEHSDDDLTGTWILDTKCITYADDMIVVQTFEPEYSGANGYVLLDKNGANPVYCKGIMYGIVPD